MLKPVAKTWHETWRALQRETRQELGREAQLEAGDKCSRDKAF